MSTNDGCSAAANCTASAYYLVLLCLLALFIRHGFSAFAHFQCGGGVYCTHFVRHVRSASMHSQGGSSIHCIMRTCLCWLQKDFYLVNDSSQSILHDCSTVNWTGKSVALTNVSMQADLIKKELADLIGFPFSTSLPVLVFLLLSFDHWSLAFRCLPLYFGSHLFGRWFLSFCQPCQPQH